MTSVKVVSRKAIKSANMGTNRAQPEAQRHRRTDRQTYAVVEWLARGTMRNWYYRARRRGAVLNRNSGNEGCLQIHILHPAL
jgi:hypothetical protein